jgi:hypothetical protein
LSSEEAKSKVALASFKFNQSYVLCERGVVLLYFLLVATNYFSCEHNNIILNHRLKPRRILSWTKIQRFLAVTTLCLACGNYRVLSCCRLPQAFLVFSSWLNIKVYIKDSRWHRKTYRILWRFLSCFFVVHFSL